MQCDVEWLLNTGSGLIKKKIWTSVYHKPPPSASYYGINLKILGDLEKSWPRWPDGFDIWTFSRCTYGMNFIILQVIHKLSMSPSRVTTISHRPFTAEEWIDISVSYVNACVITFWVLMAQMWHTVIAHQHTLNELQKLSWKKRLKG